MFGFTQTECNNSEVFANKKQTEFDKRFDEYQKIKGIPKIKGGEKKLNKVRKLQ